jgi:hypothetical protein
LKSVNITIEPNAPYRATEIVADLRNVAESLYFPMKLVGFRDTRGDIHLCPAEERRESCPHRTPDGSLDAASYGRSLERERQAILEVAFEHAGVSVYLR